MGLKKLNQFLYFDYPKFAEGKVLRVIGITDWKDYTTKEHRGKKVETVIAEDNTKYTLKDGESVSNKYEKIVFKVKKDVTVPIDARVEPVNPVCTVYGDYRNQLSVIADDIRVIIPKMRV